ncbi:hypothetical protein BJY01DRAFT_248635 [Aspergillus pseudoustus]|uniref:Zn(2)-C6 fungal-type domain-containing protein n=1 Tax=Aspergillus pseudoustus TaxID=1810923 RepID=A0ABR4JU81_9EURO
MATQPSPAPPRARRPHTKSRNGCSMCKLRKVKCTEERPTCKSCTRFGLACSLGPLDGQPVVSEGSSPSLRRGRGRPRNDWISTGASQAKQNTPKGAPGGHSSPSSDGALDSTCPWDTSVAELLLHFVSSTSCSFAASEGPDDPMQKFWSFNVPQLGLTHHFVMHLILAIAGHHLAYLRANEPSAKHYNLLATSHASKGLSGFTAALANPNPGNCGALYVSAILVCYCTFAGGPTAPGDLLVCSVGGDSGDGTSRLLIQGVRIIREMVDPTTLFSGLLEPLRSAIANVSKNQNSEPTCKRNGFPRIEWEGPLEHLREVVVTTGGIDMPAHIHALDGLVVIYHAAYGDRDGVYTGPDLNSHIFGWLYRLRAPFLDCLHRNEPVSLLILAYYAVLFKTTEKCWYMDGWMEHLILAIKNVIGPDFACWMQWPIAQISNNASTSPESLNN